MAEELHKAIAATKLMAPPTNCLSPIGDELMRRGSSASSTSSRAKARRDEHAQLDLDAAAMKPAKKTRAAEKRAKIDKKREAEDAVTPPSTPDAPPEEGVEKIKGHNYFIATVTRPPKVYRGNPFQIEVGLAYGGSWPADKTIELFRFANRVPLLFQRGACGITDAIVRTDWRNYQLSQPKGSLPVGPMALLVHIASVWVPFTSESKEAVAHYPTSPRRSSSRRRSAGASSPPSSASARRPTTRRSGAASSSCTSKRWPRRSARSRDASPAHQEGVPARRAQLTAAELRRGKA